MNARTMTIMLLFLVLLISISGAAAHAEELSSPVDNGEGAAPEGHRIILQAYNLENGHYYSLVEVQESSVDWYAARDAAAAMEFNGAQGHLATVTDLQEESFLLTQFPDIFELYVWLGASDEANEGDWIWITGEAWDYTNWDVIEPNGGTAENCLDYGNYSSFWNDENCERELNHYLVEFSFSRLWLPLVCR